MTGIKPVFPAARRAVVNLWRYGSGECQPALLPWDFYEGYPNSSPMGEKKRVIIHIDMDAFFASVEELCNPGLKGRPVIVCGDPSTRSVVAAANYPARKYGVHSGMPASTARRLCPGGSFIEGNPQKYVYFSLRLKHILESYTPEVEVFSIDECFLDVSDIWQQYGSPEFLASVLKAEISKRLQLSASAGIGPNKLLAKTASGLDKPDGLTCLWKKDLPEKFSCLPIGKLFGIGPQTEGKLKAIGIQTIDDLRKTSVGLLQKLFGVVGNWMHHASNGIDDSPVIPEDRAPDFKSVGNSYTLESDTTDLNIIMKVIYAMCCKVGRRLRQDKRAGKTLTLVIRFSDYKLISRSKTSEQLLFLDQEILLEAKKLFNSSLQQLVGLGHGQHKVRLIGISIRKLASLSDPHQHLLLGLEQRNKFIEATKSADRLRDLMGETAITWGSLTPG